MRDYIARRLGEMKIPEERALLRELLTEVVLPFYDETEAKYDALEKRVRDELPLIYDSYAVYCTVLPKENFDTEHTYLSPVITEDVEEHILRAGDVEGALRNHMQPVIGTVFYEADEFRCRQIIRDKLILNGTFSIEGEKYPFKCQLKPTERYESKVAVLYDAFLQNDVPWTTINDAYFRKFFDVCLTSLSNPLPHNAKITARRIEIDFGPYKKAIHQGLIPVWNVDKQHVNGEDYPMPALDGVNYEYHFDTKQLGDTYGFLVDYDNEFILHTRREKNFMVAVSPKPQELSWNMYRFRKKVDNGVDIYPYPVLSNARRDYFSTRLMNQYGTHIATNAEMRKLMDSFEASEYVELTGFRFAGEKLPGDTYDMNLFIRDEIRDPAFQKTLALSFRAKSRDFFLNRDIMSFLVSEFQMCYPEYRCVGALV